MDNSNNQTVLSAFPPDEPIRPPKKKKGCLKRLIWPVLLAAAAFFGYNNIHFWESTEEGLWMCRICSAVSDVQPESAASDEQKENEETQFQATGIYTVLSQIETGSKAKLTHNVNTGVLSVAVPGDTLFEGDTISIWDYRNQEIDADTYSVSWNGGTAYITLPADMAAGLYSVRSGYQDRMVASFYFGESGVPMPAASALWIEDFAAESRQTGRYLYHADGLLRTTDELDQAKEFQSTWWLSAVDISGQEAVLRSTEMDYARFECDKYVLSAEGMHWEQFYVLRYEDWYLASDADGEVYLTRELTEACFWHIVYL